MVNNDTIATFIFVIQICTLKSYLLTLCFYLYDGNNLSEE